MPMSASINPEQGETAEKPRVSVLPGFETKPLPKPKSLVPEPVTFRAFDDYGAIRKRILDGVLKAATTKYPLSNSRYTLYLHEPKYDSVEPFSLQDQKHAIIHGDSLEHKLTGTWRLTENATGKVLDEKKSVIAHVPHMTDRGTFILGGVDYTVANQMRLKPGVYSRVKDNGLIEAHVNVRPGTGPSFRIHMEPDTGIFRLAVRQSNLKLYPILRAMGVDDKEIEKSWGRDLLQKNMEAEDPRAVARAFASLVNQRASASAETAEGLKEGEEEEKSAGLFDDPEYERRCSEGSRETRDLFDVPKEVWDHLQVQKSGIQGNGLFTKCAFVPGDKVIPAFIHSAESGDPYSDYRRSIPARWMNHSETPNTKLALDGSALWIVADKEIKAGEELTGDYQTLPDCIRSLMQAPVDPHFQLEWSDGVKAAGSVSPIVPLVESLDDVAAYMMLRNRPRMKGIRTPDVSTMAGLMDQDEEKKKQQIANAPSVMDPVPTPEKVAASAIGGEDNTGIKVDPHELAMGIEVEKEHTPRTSIAKQIACDHLAEIPTYYTLLKRMEASAKAKKTEKEAQIGAKVSDRKWSQLWFRGKLVDSEKDGKHWVLLEIHRGLCEAAYKSLREEGVDCEPRFSDPHISVLREEEVDQLKKKFKHNWKGVAKVGQPMRFRLTRLVNLVPRGWAEMDRVWFIECESPEMMEYRHDLGFQSLPQDPASGHEMRFHITFAVHRNTVKKAEAEFLKFAAETDMSALSTRPQSTKPGDHGPQLLDVFNRMELDPEVTETTLGERHQNAGIPFILSTTRKLLKINAGKADVDDRDSLAFQTLHGPEDLFAERIHRDAGQTGRKLLWRSTLKGNVQHIPTGALSAQLRSVFLRSGMGQSIEESNPLDVYDQNLRVSRLGEGAMPGIESVPAEARNVQPSHFGFLDPIRSPEGPKIGVDSRVTHGTMKGSDGQFYTTMINAHTGKPQLVSALQASKSTVAFPGEMEKGNQQLRAMVKSRQVEYVHKNDVDFILPSHNQMFHPISNLTPMIGSLDGGRLLMGSKFNLQALPLRDPEAPLVQTLHESGRSFHELLGEKAGALRAKKAGVVTDIGPDHMTVRYVGGEKQTHPLFENFPFNRRTFIHNTPAVKIGDQVSPGQLLAKSNFTDAKGTLALGANFRTAYMVHHGNTFEDAIVLSESAAKRLSSEHMYQHVFDPEDSKEAGRKQFLSMFPTVYKKEQIAGINEHGVVKPGTVVHQGDPLVLALQRNNPTAVHRGHRPMFSDATETWEHGFDGVVTDVEKTKDGGWNVTVKAYAPMQEGDKLSGLHGDKGVVSKILPDGHMPHAKDGKPMEVLLNPLGVVSRGNPSQVFEALLGKVARKKGQAYKIPTFSKDSVHDFVHKELQDNGLSDTEDLTDPTSGRKIPSVLTGERFLMKLHHTSESKGRGRDVGAYTSEGLPARGGQLGSKRIASMEMNALLSHGATAVIRDAQVVRGQRNDDFWRAFKMGQTPPSPKVPFIYEKFMGFMKGAGINIKKQGDKLHLMALRDQDIDELSNGEITNKHTVTGDRMEEVPGGLFDRTVTGGHAGSKWAHIPLFEPMPNPVMEEPIRQLLGLTRHDFEDVLSGKKPLHGKIGGAAIAEALSKLNVDSAIEYNEGQVRDGSKGKRDEAVKSLGYLKALKKTGIDPKDLMLSKVPVIPPSMRPITGFKKMLITADPNLLYRDLMAANDGLKQASEVLSPEHVGQERLMLYNAFKAVTGLGDPVQSKTQQKQVKGLLAHVFGPGSPKYGLFQRRVMGAPVDIVGRATVTPNSDMDMDHVGLPEGQAWTIYRPFITRRLVRRGMPAVQAAKAVAGQTDVARKAMIEEMEERPVLINRAPTLHRYGFMAAWPVLTKNNTLQVSPVTTSGFAMDFDGDNANYHVPVSEDAVKDAIDKMMPSRNLRAVRDFKVHYVPRNEFLLGLHLASSGDNGNEPRVFKDRASALAAYKRGEIDVRDRVVIKE